MKKTWWKESIIYQIYPRSFKDTNGDGIGDLQGIIEKLDYIKNLGVDIIWLCPVYQSPNDDNGYDISDYRDIMNEFGTMQDFDLLLDLAHNKGLKIIMDLVPSHTSDEHAWFEASRKSKDNPYRDYYIWKPGKKGQLPNNWPSFFSGPAWEYDEATDEYYLHLFSKKQPDLNWENPKVREEMQDIVRFWLEKGIDGFRIDVISLISKRTDFPDADTTVFNDIIEKYYANGPRVHEFLRELNENVLSKYDIMTVGEGPGINQEHALNYVGENRKELDMVFHFGHMFMDNGPGGRMDPVPWDFQDFKQVFYDWDQTLKDKGWGSIFLGNHDFSRMVSRFGNDKEYWQQSAKLLATLLLTMRGTVYIYQGDEIGMTNVAFPSIDDYLDIEILNAWKEAEASGQDMGVYLKKIHKQGRDNARTPIQWNKEANGGFTTGTPWIKVNENFDKINVAVQEQDTDSILNYYREMIQVRKRYECLVYGSYLPVDEGHPHIFAYERSDDNQKFIIMHNFSEQEEKFTYSKASGALKLVISNYSNVEGPTGNTFTLKPWQTLVYLLEK